MEEDNYVDEAGDEIYSALAQLKRFAKWKTYENFLIELGAFCTDERIRYGHENAND